MAACPSRFTAFATLPTPDPTAAAAELEHAVTELGFVGTMVFPRTCGVHLDDDRFRPVFEAAAGLEVPISLHPQTPPRAVVDEMFSGFGDWIDIILATGGSGWHADAGLSALRLILSGTFDRHPGLQLILGHWGEMLTYFRERVDILTPFTDHLARPVGEYITGNGHTSPRPESGAIAYSATPWRSRRSAFRWPIFALSSALIRASSRKARAPPSGLYWNG